MLIKTDPDTIQSYFEDSSNLRNGRADSVVIPQDTNELSVFLREANAKKTPVTVSGGGTGTTGARIPLGGVLLSMEKFNKILDLSKETSSATVQAGVLVEDLKSSSEKAGLFYPCHPTEKTAFVGGTVATNASGARSFKYGPTRKYVEALGMVLSDGTIVKLRRGEVYLRRGHSQFKLGDGREIKIPIPSYRMPAVKNSAGYFAKDGMDLIDLFIGQEGTLSVITEIEMGLVARPLKISSSFVFFPREADAWRFSQDLKRDDSLDILSIEYFDSNSLGLLQSKAGNVPSGAKAAIYFEEEIALGNEERSLERWERLILKNNASTDETWFAMTEDKTERFAEFRHFVPEAINELVKRSRFQKLSTDIAVPDKNFIAMMEFYMKRFEKIKMGHFIFGHIGESHVHVNLLPGSDAELKVATETALEFVKKGVSLGGTVSAEHGIGKTRHKYLEEMYGKTGILEMARIKKSLDPNCILGQRNIFPLEVLF